MLGGLASRRGDTAHAGALRRQSLRAAEGAADQDTLARARRALAALPSPPRRAAQRTMDGMLGQSPPHASPSEAVHRATA